MSAAMHHRKRGAKMPWCGMVRYPGRPEFRLGVVYTADHAPDEARNQLDQLAAELLPPGFSIGHIERGALIFQPFLQEATA